MKFDCRVKIIWANKGPIRAKKGPKSGFLVQYALVFADFVYHDGEVLYLVNDVVSAGKFCTLICGSIWAFQLWPLAFQLAVRHCDSDAVG